jgi:anti-anti-sigma regulatory factor
VTTTLAHPLTTDRSTPPPVTVELPDRFDVHRVAPVRAELDGAGRPGAPVLVDASRVRFLDGAAIAALLEARAERLAHGGDLRLVSPSAAARITLELVGAWDACRPVPDAPAEIAVAA